MSNVRLLAEYIGAGDRNITASDSGAGTDTVATLTVDLGTHSDTGAGSELTALTVDLGTVSDSGAGTELSILDADTIEKTASDSGVGTDTALAEALTEKSASDSGSGSDTIAELLAFHEIVEYGIGSDNIVQFPVVDHLRTDTGTSIESAVIGLTSEGDSGTGTDAATLDVTHEVSETGEGADIATFVGFEFDTPREVRGRMSATVREAVPTAADPQAQYLYLSSATSARQYALIDISHGVPLGVGAEVLGAFLYLYKAEEWPAGTHTLSIDRITAKWDASTATWSNQPTVAASMTAAVAGTGSSGDAIAIDITSLLSPIVAGELAWYGLRISIDSTTPVKLHSAFSAIQDYRPMLKVEHSVPPAAPANPMPAAGQYVSETKPELLATWSDDDANDTLAGIWVQIATDVAFASITYDSTMVNHNAPRFDLNDKPAAAPATPTLSAGTTYYWRMKVKDNHEVESEWSDVASFNIQAKGTVAITDPAGSTVSSPTPTFAHTFTPDAAETQDQVELLIERNDGGRWVQHYLLARHVTSSTSFTLPDDYQLTEGEEYKLTVRVWDSVDRADLPGDRAYIEDTQEFTLTAVSV